MPLNKVGPTTLQAESEVIVVRASDCPMGVSAFGLAGTEEVVIHRDIGNGTFSALAETDATLTESNPYTTINASGSYKLVKTATAGLAGAAVG